MRLAFAHQGEREEQRTVSPGAMPFAENQMVVEPAPSWFATVELPVAFGPCESEQK